MWNPAVIWLFVAASWLPIAGPVQVLVYLAPAVLAGIAVLTGAAEISGWVFTWLLCLAAFALAASAFYGDTGVLHPMLGLLTYSSVVILALRFRRAAGATGASALRTFIVATAWVSLFEMVLGVAQLVANQGGLSFASLDAGDAVVGTLRTNSHLYAVKMLFQGLMLAVAWHASRHGAEEPYPRRLLLAGAASAFVGALLASALLATTAFLAAVGAWSLWTVLRLAISEVFTYGGFLRSRFFVMRALPAGAAALALLIGVAVWTQPGNVRLVVRTASGVLNGSIRVPKLEILRISVAEVLPADGKTLAVGLGLGRYSSRAAMILSGNYLRNHPDWIPRSASEETQRYIDPRWTRSAKVRAAGSILGMPTSSAQSILIEFGVVGTALLAAFAATIVRRAKRELELARAAGRNVEATVLRTVPLILWCLFAVSFTDVWLEYASLMAFVYVAIAVALSGSTAQERWSHAPEREAARVLAEVTA